MERDVETSSPLTTSFFNYPDIGDFAMKEKKKKKEKAKNNGETKLCHLSVPFRWKVSRWKFHNETSPTGDDKTPRFLTDFASFNLIFFSFRQNSAFETSWHRTRFISFEIIIIYRR